MNLSKIRLDRQLAQLPKQVQYCKRCVISNQRPRIHLNENGLCGACQYNEIKEKSTDWRQRERELQELCDKHRRNDGRFDIIVPFSGGKDSSRVAHELKTKYGMHPLTVTWAPFEYTPEGYENFRNFLKHGAINNLMAWQNTHLHAKLSRIAFEAAGDPFQPFVFGVMCYAFHIAAAFDIKLVFFGENGEAEYSGDPSVYNLKGMPFEIWAEQYFKGATLRNLIDYGLKETDYFTEKDFTGSDLTFYQLPPLENIREKNIEFHWYSYYKKWVPQENYYYATEHTGFKANPEGRSEGTYSKYASLDDRTDGFHYYMAFMKFGICRTTSDAAHEVRDGHLLREEAAALVKRFDGEFPQRWLEFFLQYLDIDEEHFWRVCNKFRSSHIWDFKDGVWTLKRAVWQDYNFPADPGYLESLPLKSREIIARLGTKDVSLLE